MTNINGPINLVRLKNNNKVIYLFMDIHMPLGQQTECNDPKSIDIKNYLVNNFDDKNRSHYIDFFLEELPDVSQGTSNYTAIYLQQIRNMFEKTFQFDFDKNKIHEPAIFNKVRLHYIDVRSYFTFTVGNPTNALLYNISKYIGNFYSKGLYPSELLTVKDSLLIQYSQNMVLYEAWKKNNNKAKGKLIRRDNLNTIKYSDKEGINMINYIMNKIKTSYTNKNVQKKLCTYMDEQLTKYFNGYFNIYDGLVKFINDSIEILSHKPDELILYNNTLVYFDDVWFDISDNIVHNLVIMIDNLTRNVREIGAIIMDIYALRRILDKDYVTNAVVYTGAFHSVHQMHILLKLFDFDITYVEYSSEKNLEDLKKKIISTDNIDQLLGVFYKKKRSQCTNIKKFPEQFK